MSFTSENTLSAKEAVNAAVALFCFIWPSRKQTTDHEETQRVPVTLGLPSSEMAFYFRATALLKYTHAFRFLFFIDRGLFHSYPLGMAHTEDCAASICRKCDAVDGRTKSHLQLSWMSGLHAVSTIMPVHFMQTS